MSDEPVELDFTDAETTEALAAKRGLADVFEADAGRTGFIVLVDADPEEEIARIGSRDTVAQIRARLRSALNA